MSGWRYITPTRPTATAWSTPRSPSAPCVMCLGYLAFGEDVALADQLVSEQYRQADNMTDLLAALSVVVAAQLPCRDALLAAFDERWHQDGLVMDKWFVLQGSSPAADVLSKARAAATPFVQPEQPGTAPVR